MEKGPLAGLRVLEMGQLIAGPLAARMMADFGAEVIKIEPRQGDPLRTWGLPSEAGSLWSLVQARNKRCITLDLKKPKAKEVVQRLVQTCDVVIENFRPGKLEEWGLGYEELKAVNPKLIMVRISGYGQTGPYRERPGFGNIAESMGGIRYLTGYPDRPPVRVGLAIGDEIAALHAVIGTLLALKRCGRTGKGQVVDVALTESVFNLLEGILPEYGKYGVIRERTGNILSVAAPSNMYLSKDDKWIAIGANGDGIFRRFTALMGKSELATDPRFLDNPARVAHVQELDEIISAWVRGLDAQETLAKLEKAGVPCGPVYSIADIAADPQFQARGMIREFFDPRIGKMLMPGVVPILSDTPGQIRWAGPGIGADNEVIYKELLGLSSEQYEAFQKEELI
ncbi:MAG: CoA transferase [Desulfitobacteriaceae bacterium]|nr:CoA transferase [Desulfitobacteriaceae bacterium]MDI6879081.1 CoA transferase [Desulfitobacteriaceae bacterium]MDI6913878.1 CoA transferase [Desulfitobacteriaceae bacterium]